jgi:hypothetical protein
MNRAKLKSQKRKCCGIRTWPEGYVQGEIGWSSEPSIEAMTVSIRQVTELLGGTSKPLGGMLCYI